MPRAYTAATIALVLRVPTKWVDNVLSHNVLSDVRQGTQGVSREIGTRGLLELFTAKSLCDFLEVPLPAAIRLSRRLLDAGQEAAGSHLLLTLNRERQAGEIAARLEYAVEAAPLPKRGRPPTKTKRGA